MVSPARTCCSSTCSPRPPRSSRRTPCGSSRTGWTSASTRRQSPAPPAWYRPTSSCTGTRFTRRPSNMAERFSDRLYRAAQFVWEAQHRHPFVRGIGDGTLDVGKFRFWVRQDYLFLIDYARLLALAVARAPDLPTMRRFADLVQATLNGGMDLHPSYAAGFGISLQALEAEEKAPTTHGYTDFLLRVAPVGDFAGVGAALLPCMWGFSD